ncbi:MAG TPA: serine hydrolase [Bradyrhizobium sp.]|nr:serine hydrolase [Bradyrhizobium sp.]
MTRFAVLAFVALLLVGGDAQAQGPVFSPTGPDAEGYGAAAGFPPGTVLTAAQQEHLVATYSHFDELVPARVVARAAAPWPFKRVAEPAIFYRFGGQRHPIQDYLDRNPATGLLIAKDDTILYEHYQYARTDRDRLVSQSMAKTIAAMLVGIALAEGSIKSTDDLAASYVPALAGTEYGATTLRSLLQMTSGIAFSEVYDNADDIAQLSRDLVEGKDPAASVARFNTRVAPAGARFQYASSETEVLGLVLRAATGVPLADYLRDKIWQPIGAEADASWVIDHTGQELAFCCFNAVLRDYARLGRLLAHDGAWEGRQLIPRQWVLDATTLSADGPLAPGTATPYFGYGYQTFLFPGAPRRFALMGIRGQIIMVDPASKLVMVHTAVRKQPSEEGSHAEPIALWLSLLAQFGKP